LLNGFREDTVRDGLDIEEALDNAPERTRRAVKVPLVIASEGN
jgi:Asp-tRNA(Asn)/Glu-tRNA(Gln) amidotransferase C subunit